jgi:hypothetical protein
MAKGILGTLMYGVAWTLRQAIGGEEWWQLKTGKKGENGQPVYLDIRRWHPFSDVMHIADLVDRIYKGQAMDIKLGDELLEAVSGIKRVEGSPGLWDAINTVGDYWGEEPTSAKGLALTEAGGRFASIPLTPLLNLRDLFAQFSKEENRKKDLRGEGFWGPSLDRLPWFRRRLPDLNMGELD